MFITQMNLKQTDERMGKIIEQNGTYHFDSCSTVFDCFSDFVQLSVDNAKVRLSHLWVSDDNLSVLPEIPDQIMAIALTSVKEDETVDEFCTRMNDLYMEYMDLDQVCSDPTYWVYDI